MYLFVRKDLPLEQIVVQSTHAGIELARKGLIPLNFDHPNLVVIGVDHEQKLLSTFANIEQKGVQCIPFFETDLNNEMTAFATEPIQGERRQLFRRFNCLRIPTIKEPANV